MITKQQWYAEFTKLYDTLDCDCEECRLKIVKTNSSALLKILFDSMDINFIPYKYVFANRRNARIISAIGSDLLYDRDYVYGRIRTQNKVNKSNTNSNHKHCRGCGEKAELKHMVIVYDSTLTVTCDLCFKCSSRFNYCAECDSWYRSSNSTLVWKSVDGRKKYGEMTSKKTSALDRNNNELYIVMCRTCAQEKTAPCQACGDHFYTEHVVEVESQRGQAWEIEKRFVCTRCATMKKCRKCGKEYINTGTMSYCRSCDEDQRLVHDHQYRPYNIRYLQGKNEGAVSKEALRFGVEIEVENDNSYTDRSAMSAIVKEKFGYDWLYCVHDGTVHGGSEFVSYPFTWQHYIENRERWIEFFMLLRQHNWKGDSVRCGFHVHTTKAAWTSYQLYKLCKFIYDSKNHPFITTVAQRNFNSYCRIDSADTKSITKLAKDKKNRTEGHYAAINLNSSRTIEFRFFQGSLEPWYFFKNIEFTKALYDYTNLFNVSKMNAKDFQAHILSNKKKYYYLRTFIEQFVTGTAFKKKPKVFSNRVAEDVIRRALTSQPTMARETVSRNRFQFRP